MTVCCRILFIAVLASYVVGLGVFAASATAMAGNMISGATAEMEDCRGCEPVDSDDPAPDCETPCLTPLIAMLSPDAALFVPVSERSGRGAGHSFAGRSGPPDPSPPKSSLLS